MKRREWTAKDDETVGAQIRIANQLRAQQTEKDRKLIRVLKEHEYGDYQALGRILELLVDGDLRKARR